MLPDNKLKPGSMNCIFSKLTEFKFSPVASWPLTGLKVPLVISGLSSVNVII